MICGAVCHEVRSSASGKICSWGNVPAYNRVVTRGYSVNFRAFPSYQGGVSIRAQAYEGVLDGERDGGERFSAGEAGGHDECGAEATTRAPDARDDTDARDDSEAILFFPAVEAAWKRGGADPWGDL